MLSLAVSKKHRKGLSLEAVTAFLQGLFAAPPSGLNLLTSENDFKSLQVFFMYLSTVALYSKLMTVSLCAEMPQIWEQGQF